MTRFLKLVRHQNGSWQALPAAETDDLAPVTVLKEDAPIDPTQLLKALAPLLSTDGGISNMEKATQFASLMKKFSKKLVSRCVYCNVLKATKPEIITKFLSEGGWNTINSFLNDAKENSNEHFLIELLELCKMLPMTVERLKENNTPKLVKALTKFENNDIKSISENLVTKWMTLIKGDAVPIVETIKRKKKLKTSKESDKEQRDPRKTVKKDSPTKEKKELKRTEKPTKESDAQKSKRITSPKSAKESLSSKTVREGVVLRNAKRTCALKDAKDASPPKSAAKETAVPKCVKESSAQKTLKELSKQPVKLKGGKRTSTERDVVETDLYEDVTIKIEPEPAAKKLRVERPKTVKSYQAKFRATGLEEEIPLPKKIPKKSAAVDKSAAAVAKSAVNKRLNSALPERITEKKLKPESLLTVNETSNANGGIKLIPAKPRPAHILHESASFMDALVAQPAAAPKRKKRPPNKPPTPTTPPSPTSMKPPKLQFYKDTLEMNSEDSKKDAPETDAEDKDKESPASPGKEEPMEVSEKDEDDKDIDENPGTPINDIIVLAENAISEKMQEGAKAEGEVAKGGERDGSSNELKSILAHGRQRNRKKNVQWVADENLKEIFYFELDETERVNVLRTRAFGDLKTLEAKRERELFEAAKRHAGDKMEEAIPWWPVPILIDVPPPLVDPGLYSQEREIQLLRQQSILQEIYFTREMVPDTPQEPDVELIPPQEPKIIPLDEENVVGSLIDYSGQEIPKPQHALPEVLSSLIKIPSMLSQQPVPVSQAPHDAGMIHPPQNSISPASPYDPGEPMGPSLLGPPPTGLNSQQMFNSPSMMMEQEGVGMPNNWNPIDGGMMPNDPFYGNYPVNPMMMDGMPPMPRGGMRPRMNGPLLGGGDMFRPNMAKGGIFPRPGGHRRGVPRVLCRHFAAGGCRYGISCNFLHPGVNGPPL